MGEITRNYRKFFNIAQRCNMWGYVLFTPHYFEIFPFSLINFLGSPSTLKTDAYSMHYTRCLFCALYTMLSPFIIHDAYSVHYTRCLVRALYTILSDTSALVGMFCIIWEHVRVKQSLLEHFAMANALCPLIIVHPGFLSKRQDSFHGHQNNSDRSKNYTIRSYLLSSGSGFL